jgi:hypothetical protein
MDNARRRRWWILNALRDYPTSAEGLMNALHSAWQKKSVHLKIGLSALRRDLVELEKDGLVRLEIIRHTCPGAKTPGRFRVAHITTAGRRKHKQGEYVFLG